MKEITESEALDCIAEGCGYADITSGKTGDLSKEIVIKVGTTYWKVDRDEIGSEEYCSLIHNQELEKINHMSEVALSKINNKGNK